VKCRAVAVVAVLTFVPLIGWANPPEYLAATREPPDDASELASPLEEVIARPQGWQLGTGMTEPFFRDLIFSLEPRSFYRHLDDGEGLHEAFATGGSMSFITGWWRDTLQFGIVGYSQAIIGEVEGGGGHGRFPLVTKNAPQFDSSIGSILREIRPKSNTQTKGTSGKFAAA
jgi:hypothetical protein